GIAIACLLFATGNLATAQHTSDNGALEAHDFKHFRVSAMLYHTYIGTHTTEGREILIVPSVGLDLEYWFNEKWGIGSHNDLELITLKWNANIRIPWKEKHLFSLH